MTRALVGIALATAALAPAAASASETCWYRSGNVYVCRDAEYRACVAYASVGVGPRVEVGNGCP